MQSGDVAALASVATDRIESKLRSAALPLLGCGVVLALLAWPILQVTNPMLADYPNHLARLFVTENLATSDLLARYYFIQGGFYPYLPMELLVRPLGRIVGLELAGRIFVVLSAAMPLIGTLVLARTLHGKVGLWPLVSALFAYNHLLSWGFVTFLFSLGLALIAFAGWIATDRWAWLPRLVLFSVITTLVFCSHPFAFGAFALLVGAWEVGRTTAWSWTELRQAGKRLCLAGLQFTPSLLLASLLASQIQEADIAISITRFGALSERVIALLSPVLFLSDTSEIASFWVLVLAFTMALRRGILVFDRRMTWPVVVVAMASLLTPAVLSGVAYVHIRLPFLLVLLIIASCRPQPQPKPMIALAAAMLAALLAIRTTMVADRLAAADREISEMRAAAAAIEEGARVLPAMTSARSGGLPRNNYWHAQAYLTIDRSAFYPLLFSVLNVDVVPEYKPSSHPAAFPVRFGELVASAGASEQERHPSAQPRYWHNWRKIFDYVIVFDFGEPPDVTPEGLSLVQRGAVFAIYKVIK